MWNKTIIGQTSQAKSSYSRPEKKRKTHTHKLQTPSKKLGKINTLNTVLIVLTELKSTSAGKLFQTFIILSQKKELRRPELYGLWSLYTRPLVLDVEFRTKNHLQLRRVYMFTGKRT